MARGRSILRVLLAAAVAFAPLGAGVTTAHANSAPVAVSGQGHGSHHHAHHAGAHDAHSHGTHATMGGHDAVMPKVAEAAPPCHGEQTGHADHADHGSCCDDTASCGAGCLTMCSMMLSAVMPAERSERIALADRFLTASVDRPPDWTASPQPPPPRA